MLTYSGSVFRHCSATPVIIQNAHLCRHGTECVFTDIVKTFTITKIDMENEKVFR